MIPDTASAFVSFLLFLAPGAVWSLRRAKYRASVKETVLSEAARVVLVSMAATSAAAVVLSWWMWLPLYEDLVAGGSSVDGSSAGDVRLLAAVIVNAVIACGLVLLLSLVVWRGPPPIAEVRVWHRAFVEWVRSPDLAPMLTIELLDGTIWRGKLKTFDTDPDDQHRNIAIIPPLRRRRPGDDEFRARDHVGAVLLPEAQIRAIQIAYPDSESGSVNALSGGK